MFTGIVEGVGEVLSCDLAGDIYRLVLRTPRPFEGLAVGGSISVNGCCLTATKVESSTLAFDLARETVMRTRFDLRLRPGAGVNLERPLRLSSGLDGHFVQGHVDGVGTVEAVEETGSARELALRIPAELSRYCVEKGSIALDGVSLTCAQVTGSGVRVALIPHTLAVTTLGGLKVGDLVNLEVDLIAKYVEKLLPK